MLQKYYYTTDDYNGMLITDGKRAYDLSSFPQDGTVELARNFDTSGIDGCETLEEVASLIGTGKADFFPFNESEYTSTALVGEL